jgi:hypothetical protein
MQRRLTLRPFVADAAALCRVAHFETAPPQTLCAGLYAAPR